MTVVHLNNYGGVTIIMLSTTMIFQTLPHKNSPRIKTPNPKLMILESFYTKKKFLPNQIKNQSHFVNDLVEIKYHNCCVLFGPPCIAHKYLLTLNE